MSAAEPFFDTNILLYLLSADAAKADRAESLLAEGGTISLQVLNEFASAALRKLELLPALLRGPAARPVHRPPAAHPEPLPPRLSRPPP